MISLASNIPLLRTGFVPDEKETAQLRCIMSLHAAMLTDLDKNIANLQRTLESLQAQRTLVSDSLVVNNSLFSPIRRLAPEILGEIFMYCIPPRADVEFQRLIPERRHGASAVLPLLLHVCYRWRDVAQGMSSLWTDVPIYDHDCIPCATMFLQNSGSSPLNIYLHHQYPGVEFVELLVDKSPYFHRLEYSGPYYGLELLSPPGNLRKFPSLKHLLIDIKSSPPETIPDLSSMLGAASIHTLTLRRAAVDFIPFIQPTSHLRKLILQLPFPGAISKAELFTLLRCCPGIEYFDIGCINSPDQTLAFNAENEDTIPFPALRELRMDTDDAGLGLLRIIRAPNVRSVTLRYGPYDWNDLDFFLLETRKNLCQLSFVHFDLSSATLGESMKVLAELETLEVSRSSIANDLWASMTPDTASPPTSWVCPRLAHLDICETPLGVEFMEFIRRRTEMPSHGGGSPGGGGYIRDVTLLQCALEEDDSKALSDLQLERIGLSITYQPLPDDPRVW